MPVYEFERGEKKMSDNNTNNYKIPNSSTGMVKAPVTIIKNQGTPKKTTGGDLRSK
jgi:hypothetical protein